MWTKKMFGVEKPIIALLHVRALPGDPLYDSEGGLEKVISIAEKELADLQDGGVDGIAFANEFSLPYQKKVDYVTVSTLAYIIGRLRSKIHVPYGINVVMNPFASIDLAAATGASFVRSAFTGAYVGEAGILDTDVANVVRRKHYLCVPDLKMFYKVNPESDTYLAPRDIDLITKSIIFHCAPDALCVSGESSGSETDINLLKKVSGIAGDIPVFCNTGCNVQNIIEKLQCCDGAFVGTTFKIDGKFHNVVDPMRVKEFMDTVKAYRKTLE
jgi:membrane complex biogenesis BtpA family protein